MSLPSHVSIVEVGPRDGLQNEPQSISVQTKVSLIEQLAEAGCRRIEAGSFVNPKWVPQMAGSEDVFATLKRRDDTHYSALTPNLRGLERAIAAGVKEVAVFAAASEAFSQKNINCSISDSLQRFEPVMALAQTHNIAVRGYISCVSGCPYQGAVSEAVVASLSQELLQLGCFEVSLGDTIGVATPNRVQSLIETVAQQVPTEQLAWHGHDTYGQGIANVMAALKIGVATIDSAIAGLGGCPYAKGATGNVATEDVVYLLNGLGIECGIDITALAYVGDNICRQLQKDNQSKAGPALLANLTK